MSVKNWKDVKITKEASIINAVEVISKSGFQIALVVDDKDRLLGTVTDGDIRRALLKSIALTEPVHKIMNPKPVTSNPTDPRDTMLEKMKALTLRQLPLIDEQGTLVGLELSEYLAAYTRKDNWVVLMAGGMGTRLAPLTNDTPKPLLTIGDKPLLETIINNFIEYGFLKFYLSVNYKAEMIQKYFGDGSKWGVEIQYLQEKERMGTAGALTLLPKKPTSPLIVMNGDLLTKVNFDQLLDFHNDRRADATMAIREYDFQVPYGVVNLDQDAITAVDEKPIQKFFVSAGIYILAPSVLSHLPGSGSFDMPNLFQELLRQKAKVKAFPIREYWMDIGRMEDLAKANHEYASIFRVEDSGR